MARFSYSAIMGSGKRVTGTLRSRSRREALRQLLNRGCHPLEVGPSAQLAPGRRLVQRLLHRVSVSDLAVFTRQLALLLGAGMRVVEALDTLRRQCPNRRLASVLQDVEETVLREGVTLADALDDHPRVFDPVYRGVVRSGEEGGNQVATLSGLARHLDRKAKLRGQVTGALIYPVFLMVLGAGAVFVLMAFVIPRFEELFAGFGQSLPGPTQLLIAVSGFLSRWWWAVLIALGVAVLAIIASLRRPAVGLRVDRALLGSPVLGSVLVKLEVARIARTLGALLGSGVAIIEALRITAQTARNRCVAATFSKIVEGVSGGESLAGMVAQAGLYPPLMVNLIRTGESTGQLPEMLAQLSDIYEDESQRAVTGAVKLLEPCLILFMGAVIAAIVAAVMLPVFQANTMVS